MSSANHVTYKRDQVEQAIAITSTISPQHEPKRFAALKIELKRLLDRDRRQEEETPHGSPVRRAFHNGPSPGRGIDVMYSGYEAFALLIGLRLMRGGLPQATGVEFIRDLRGPLSAFHAETLKLSPDELRPDLSRSNQIGRMSSGSLIDDPKKMAYLIALAGDHSEAFDLPGLPGRAASGNICLKVEDLLHRMRWASHTGHTLIVVELVNAAHHLAYHLNRIEPRTRGRR